MPYLGGLSSFSTLAWAITRSTLERHRFGNLLFINLLFVRVYQCESCAYGVEYRRSFELS